MLRKLLIASLLLLTCCLIIVPAQGASLLGTRIGATREAGLIINNGSMTTTAMAANDAGWDARFAADSTLDVLAVTVNWTSVSVPGTVSIFVETDDGTGKPSGTLYDANATLTLQVPGAGVKTYTFVTPPSTHLTIGSLYHVLIITTGVGTTQTLGSYVTVANPGSNPTAVLTTATATTRNTFAVVANTAPAVVLTRTGPVSTSFETMFQPFTSTLTGNNIFGTTAAAASITTQGTLTLTGYVVDVLSVTGTPAGDLRFRLMDVNSNVVAGTTVTVDKDTIVNGRGLRVSIGVPISITASTYRMVLDSASSANSSNCYKLNMLTALDSTAIPNATLSTTSDVTATPPTWVDTTTGQVPMALLINTITIPATSGGIIGG